MALETFEATLTGVRPLLMHNGHLADPTGKHKKALAELTGKKKKTDADHEEIKRIEWLGGLYLDDSGAISITESMVLGAIIGGARVVKKGKLFEAGCFGARPFFQLAYKGPSDPLELFNGGKHCDYRLVGVDRKKIMRARPVFNQWSVRVALLFESSVLNRRDVQAALEAAGSLIGLGDFRPRYGRFSVQVA